MLRPSDLAVTRQQVVQILRDQPVTAVVQTRYGCLSEMLDATSAPTRDRIVVVGDHVADTDGGPAHQPPPS
jgi:hypothetical protein